MTFEIQEESKPSPKAIDSNLWHRAHLPQLESQEDRYNIFLAGFVPGQLPENVQQMSSNNRKQIPPLWTNYLLNLIF